MQFLFSRLASPPVNCDFDDERNDVMSSTDDRSSSRQSRASVLASTGLQQQQDCCEMSHESTAPDSTRSVRQRLSCVGQRAAFTERPCHNAVLQQQDCTDRSGGLSDMPTTTVTQLQADRVRQQHDSAETSHDASVLREAQHQDSTAQQSTSTNRFDLGQPQSDHTVKSDTESILSLNELLDGCQCDTDAGETFAIDTCDADEYSMQPSISQLCEIVNLLHVSVDTANTDLRIPQISDNGRPRLALNSRPGRSVRNAAELTGQNEAVCAAAADVMQASSPCSPVVSPLMQHSIAESDVSSLSGQAHADSGCHSNPASQEPTALLCVM